MISFVSLTFALIIAQVHSVDADKLLKGMIRPCDGTQISLAALSLPPPPLDPDTANPCSFARIGGTELRLSYISGPHGMYRVVEAKRPEAVRRRIIVLLVGGPRGGLVPKTEPEFDATLTKTLADLPDTTVIMPEYLGTGARSLYPRTDVVAAGEEVIDLVRTLSREYPDARVELWTHSAGALVAFNALRRAAIPVTMVAPPLHSLRRIFTDSVAHDLPANTPRHSRSMIVGQLGSNSRVVATETQQAAAFAGSDYQRDFADMVRTLPPVRRRCIRVVVGRNDRRIGIENLSRSRAALPRGAFTVVDDLPHSPLSDHAFGNAIKMMGEPDRDCVQLPATEGDGSTP